MASHTPEIKTVLTPQIAGHNLRNKVEAEFQSGFVLTRKALSTPDLCLNLNRLLKNHLKPGKNLATNKNHLSVFLDKWLIIMLLCQGSNLNFSDPESDVLPITPQSSMQLAKIYQNS